MHDTSIELVVRRHLEKWTLHDNTKEVSVKQIGTIQYIGYEPNQRRLTGPKTTFSLNIKDDTLYILFIQIHDAYRGKGYGSELLQIIEGIGRELGCKQIIGTPSGWTYKREPRYKYYVRRGYSFTNGVCIKTLCST